MQTLLLKSTKSVEEVAVAEVPLVPSRSNISVKSVSSKKSTKSAAASVHAEETSASEELSPEVPTESPEVVAVDEEVVAAVEEPVVVEAITRDVKPKRQSAWSKMKKIMKNKLKKKNFSE